MLVKSYRKGNILTIDLFVLYSISRGSAMTQEGISRSMGTPTVHCEALAMTQALQDADLSPEKVSYVEAHGTG